MGRLLGRWWRQTLTPELGRFSRLKRQGLGERSLGLVIGGEAECRFKQSLGNSQGDDCQGNDQVFDALSFHLGTLWAESLSGAKFILK